MNALPIGRRSTAAKTLIEDAIRENGAARVLITAALAVLRGQSKRRARPPDASDLTKYLRRDIGLPPEPEVPDWRQYLR